MMFRLLIGLNTIQTVSWNFPGKIVSVATRASLVNRRAVLKNVKEFIFFAVGRAGGGVTGDVTYAGHLQRSVGAYRRLVHRNTALFCTIPRAQSRLQRGYTKPHIFRSAARPLFHYQGPQLPDECRETL